MENYIYKTTEASEHLEGINQYAQDACQYWKDKKEMGICEFLYLREKYDREFIVIPKEQRYGMSLGSRGVILMGGVSS